MSDDDYPLVYYSDDIPEERPGRRKKSLRDHRVNAVVKAKQPRRRNVVRREPGRCHYCKQMFPEHTLTKDHVVPKSRGGVNRMWNIVPACLACNQAKAEKWPECNCDFCRETIRRHADMGITFMGLDSLHPRDIRDHR